MLLRDHLTLVVLYEAGATLVLGDDRPIRGEKAITRAGLTTAVGVMVAHQRRVFLAPDTWLVVIDRCINVIQRGDDGA